MAQHYPSAAAIHRALLARPGSQAKTSGRTTEELQREYFTQRFLARVFSSPDSQWILTGGGGCSFHPWGPSQPRRRSASSRTDIIGAVDELRALSVHPDLDRFTFEIENVSLTGVSLRGHRTHLGRISATTVTPHRRRDYRCFDAAALAVVPVSIAEKAKSVALTSRTTERRSSKRFSPPSGHGSDSGTRTPPTPVSYRGRRPLLFECFAQRALFLSGVDLTQSTRQHFRIHTAFT